VPPVFVLFTPGEVEALMESNSDSKLIEFIIIIIRSVAPEHTSSNHTR
jgi:hypothetical protein